ncbi:MAG: peptide deformylase [Devosia sp.]|nr:peptide deformylase [Devosia sp.]MDB5539637.1 peptide deformylase [Devosia sp.]
MIVAYPDPRLNRKAEPRPLDEGLRAIGTRLLEAARGANAYGLAAIHIGALAPVVVISTAADPGKRSYLVLYNPEIVATAEELESGPEGSVSMPGVEVDVVRSGPRSPGTTRAAHASRRGLMSFLRVSRSTRSTR